MTATPFDHRWLSALLGDEEIAAHFTIEAELASMLVFEAALARAEAAEGAIPVTAAEAIAHACKTFVPDHADLADGALRDGLVVPAFVKQLRREVGPPHDAHVHHGSTSQDVLDTALMLRLKPVVTILEARLAHIVVELDGLTARHGARIVMGRTRMQDALTIPLATRITSWRAPLAAHRARLADIAPRLLRLQCGGAVGTRDKLGENADAIATRLAAELQLGPADPVWHATRDSLAEFTSLLAMISGSLGKLGADVALMAQNGVGEVRVAGAGGSSAMPHKQNPIAAEALVALARHNATLSAGMQQALVHEGERSGAMWTLEWLTLPQMCVTTGAATRQAARLVAALEFE
ncbi:MAG: 3-carboxy-cis,cis-muconate cycloisomerase [Hyphomicrobiaceae bacterium]